MDAQTFVKEKRGQVENDYDIISTVKDCNYGEVKKVVHKLTGDVRAMKIIRKEECDELYLKGLVNEITLLRKLDHPNIIKLYEIY